jgi:peptidyl-prolyl cis-trans isomerase B (cyclophilin B)
MTFVFSVRDALHYVVLSAALTLILPALSSAESGNMSLSPSLEKNTLMTAPTLVKMHTNCGDFVIALDTAKAPKTVANFLTYAKEGFYDHTIFHRVIDGFMIQGGGFERNMKQKKTHDPIENEANNGLKNDKYTIAMARTMDPKSATAQFFINGVDNHSLNFTAPTAQGWGYAVFGKVIDGTEIVDKIMKVKTSNSGFYQDVPVDEVVIKNVKIIEQDAPLEEAVMKDAKIAE